LVTQGQELLKYTATLRKKLAETSNLFDEIDKSRNTEIEEVLKKTIEEKRKFTDMIKDIAISYEEEKKKFELLEQEFIKQQDLCMNFNHINTILKESDEKYNNLNKETIILRGQVKELSERLNLSNTQVNDLTERVATLVG
jgi:chromosome segregation ATPase